jgi:hypothetical protein
MQAGPGGGPALACDAGPPLFVLIVAPGRVIAPGFRHRVT